jgi:hypothetical protein
MAGALTRAALLAAVATAGLSAAVETMPRQRPLLVSAYLLLLGALALRLLVRWTWWTYPRDGRSELDAALSAKADPPAPAAPLVALTRTVALAHASAGYAHSRLRPRLRALAADLLRWHHGIALDQEPERAAAALGPLAWSWLRPDRAEPADRDGPGPPLATISELIAGLERLETPDVAPAARGEGMTRQ